MTTATYFGTTESISVTSTTAGGTIDATISAKQYYNPSRS